MKNLFSRILSLTIILALLMAPVAVMEESSELPLDIGQAEMNESNLEVSEPTDEMPEVTDEIPEVTDVVVSESVDQNVPVEEAVDLTTDSEEESSASAGGISEEESDLSQESVSEAANQVILEASEASAINEESTDNAIENNTVVAEAQASEVIVDASETAPKQILEASGSIPVLRKSVRTTVTAAPGTVFQLDLGGATASKFKSSKRKVATVDGNAMVTIKGAGKTKISFKVGKKKRTLNLTVKDPTIPRSIALNMSGTNIVSKGTSVTLTATLPEGTYSNIKWKSSNKKVARVKNGVVTFRKKGNATITATTVRGKKKAKVKFKVTNTAPSVTAPSPTTTTDPAPATPVENVLFELEKNYKWTLLNSWYMCGLVVRNTGSVTRDCVADLKFYDSNNQLVGVAKRTVYAVAPGYQVFITCMNDYDFSRFEYTFTAAESIYTEVQSIVNIQVQTLQDKAIISGTNVGSIPAEFVEYDCLFLDAQNRVVSHGSGYLVDSDYELKPGMTEYSESSVYDPYDHVEVYYTGRYYQSKY